MRRLLALWWWRLRGVGAFDYRRLCGRCHRTGQVHWSAWGCWRFKAMTHNRPSKESLAEIPELDVSKSKIVGRGLLKDRRLHSAR